MAPQTKIVDAVQYLTPEIMNWTPIHNFRNEILNATKKDCGCSSISHSENYELDSNT